MIVTMAHLRTVPGFSPRDGWCSRGGRAWFKRHGLDWLGFVRNGVPEETLLATGCGLARALVDHAHRTEEVGRGQQ